MTNKATHKKARSCPALFIVVVALAALGATASIVAAQATPGTQFRVNSGIADWQSNPAVAMDPTGVVGGVAVLLHAVLRQLRLLP